MTTASVGCELRFDSEGPATVALAIAAASAEREQLDAVADRGAVEVDKHVGAHGTRFHVVRSPGGPLTVRYIATALVDHGAGPPPATALERLEYIRPSRYCPSDEMVGLATAELGHVPIGPELLTALGAWVGRRLAYVPGSSRATDTAVHTLLGGQGVCRDYAHVAVTVLRALGVPARLVGVYAPGLTPMDLHAVTEAWVDGAWWIVDTTRLAPRQSLVRVATGRDAADTAFITNLDGEAELVRMEVTAWVDGDLPVDDHLVPVALGAPTSG